MKAEPPSLARRDDDPGPFGGLTGANDSTDDDAADKGRPFALSIGTNHEAVVVSSRSGRGFGLSVPALATRRIRVGLGRSEMTRCGNFSRVPTVSWRAEREPRES